MPYFRTWELTEASGPSDIVESLVGIKQVMVEQQLIVQHRVGVLDDL